MHDEIMMSNGNIKCSMRIDGFVGQQQNRYKTEWAGIKANGLELGFGVFFFFFLLFQVCAFSSTFNQCWQSHSSQQSITASETPRKFNQTHNYGCETGKHIQRLI